MSYSNCFTQHSPNSPSISLDRVKGTSDLQLQDLKCTLCKNLVIDPVALSPEQICCSKCFPKKFGKFNIIPCSKIPETKKLLSAIDIKCRFYTQGCLVEDKLTQILEHEKICDYKLIKCQCGKTISQGNMDKHLKENQCDHTKCSKCNKKFLRSEIEKHILECQKPAIDLSSKNYSIEESKSDKISINSEMSLENKHIHVTDLIEIIKNCQQSQLLTDKILLEFVSNKQINKMHESKRIKRIERLLYELQAFVKGENVPEISRIKRIQKNIQNLPEKCQLCNSYSNLITKCEFCSKIICEKCMYEAKIKNKSMCKICYNTEMTSNKKEEDEKIIDANFQAKKKIMEDPSNAILKPIAILPQAPPPAKFWHENSSSTESVGHISATNHDNILYFISNLKSNSLILYDLKTKCEITHKINFGRYYSRISSVKLLDTIYISGGMPRLHKPPIADAEKIFIGDFSKITRSNIAPMLQSRFCHTLIGINNEMILCISGCYSKENGTKFIELKNCEIYDIKKDLWKITAELNSAKVDTSACNFSNKIIYTFGSSYEKRDNSFKPEIEKLHINKPYEEWKWEIVECKRNNVLTKKIFCNFVQINESEILMLNINGKSCTFDTATEKFTNEVQNDFDISEKRFLKKHLETGFSVYENEIYLMDRKKHKFLKYSINQKKWSFSDIQVNN